MAKRPQYQLHPLDDCFERVRRAEEHLADFKRMLEAVKVKQAKSIPLNFDPNPPHEWVRAFPKETFYGLPFGIRIGEIAYNLRAAMDYLVFHLAELDSGSRQDGTQFPIEGTAKSFRFRVNKGWLKGVNAAHVAKIEALQPYNGCDWSRRLQSISNPDKHREMVRHLGESRITVHWEEGKDLSRIVGVDRKATHPTRGAMDVKVHVAISVTFDDGTSVVGAVHEIKSGVAQTLADLKPDF
jgi:hypothetical protein